MVGDYKIAEIVLTRVQNLVRFTGPENDTLALFGDSYGISTADAAAACNEYVQLFASEIGMEVSQHARDQGDAYHESLHKPAPTPDGLF